MSLPHTLFECNKCKFCLSAGPDRYDNYGQHIWGRLAVCLACCEEHLVGNDYSDPEPRAHAVFAKDASQVSKQRPWPVWKKTSQACELLPWFATGAPKREEWVDVTRARCVNCGQPELRLWLFHRIQCPACQSGALQESFTG
jgi:hypothetical protein